MATAATATLPPSLPPSLPLDLKQKPPPTKHEQQWSIVPPPWHHGRCFNRGRGGRQKAKSRSSLSTVVVVTQGSELDSRRGGRKRRLSCVYLTFIPQIQTKTQHFLCFYKHDTLRSRILLGIHFWTLLQISISNFFLVSCRRPASARVPPAPDVMYGTCGPGWFNRGPPTEKGMSVLQQKANCGGGG